MSFSRPTLQQLIDRTRNDLVARIAADDVLRRADVEVQARVMAATAHALYGFIAYLGEQMMYDTAGTEYLDRWASIWLTQARKPASVASGNVTFNTSIGAVIPNGTLIKAFDGIDYVIPTGDTAIGTTLVLAAQAVVAGKAGNRTTGQTLTLTTPIAGVETGATGGEFSGGSDIESDDELRGRLLERIRTPPQGGALTDYVRWAKEVSGVTRVWAYENWAGGGTVRVLFVRDNDGSIIPDAGEIATVDAYLRDGRKPAGCVLTTGAPIASPLNFTMTVFPNTDEVKDAILLELIDLIKREASPGGTIFLSHIRAAISGATGEDNFVLTSPSADVVEAAGYITTMGSVSW